MISLVESAPLTTLAFFMYDSLKFWQTRFSHGVVSESLPESAHEQVCVAFFFWHV